MIVSLPKAQNPCVCPRRGPRVSEGLTIFIASCFLVAKKRRSTNLDHATCTAATVAEMTCTTISAIHHKQENNPIWICPQVHHLHSSSQTLRSRCHRPVPKPRVRKTTQKQSFSCSSLLWAPMTRMEKNMSRSLPLQCGDSL